MRVQQGRLLIESGDAVLRARVENFRFEERVDQTRQARYETAHGPAEPAYEGWLETRMDYLSGSVYIELPETFLPLNAEAALAPAVWSDLGSEQVLIRVESLDYALGETKVRSLADLEHILAIYRTQRQHSVGKPRRVPPLPNNISGIIDGMRRECREEGLTEKLWREMAALLDQVKRHADATGESYYLVTSCTNIARIVMKQTPGHALALTRRALLWSPSDGHAWSVRATGLDCLGRPDLAEAVLWEAVRRIPSHAALYIDLALTWVGRGALGAAEALLRKAAVLEPSDEPTFVELARVLWLRGCADEALSLLRDYLGRAENAVALYTLGCLLVAEGRGTQATEVLERYRHVYGNDYRITRLVRLIATGAAGQEEQRAHPREPRRRGGTVQGVHWDAEAAERALASEQTELPRLQQIGRVGQADLLFRLGPERRAEALSLVDAALADPADAYAQVVKGLAVPEHRLEMLGRAGRFAGSLPVRLALTPQDVGPDHWRHLIERFPERQHLTRLVQIARRQADDSIIPTLSAWCKEPTRWDNGWDAYLKKTLRPHLDGETTLVDLDTLAHDALTQAVDVGQDAVPLAA